MNTTTVSGGINMLKSLYSGVSGMKNLQTKMDVISNNIANVNTTSFKTGRVRFEDMISQTMEQSQENKNSKQSGLGMQVSAVDKIMAGGTLQATGRALDFGIENGEDSFFTVSSDGTSQDVAYTRDGGMYLNADNQLITTSGYHILGVMLDTPVVYQGTIPAGLTYDAATNPMEAIAIPKENNGTNLDSYSISDTGLILGVYNDEIMVMGQISLTKFNNATGLDKMGGNMYKETMNSGQPNVGAAGQEGFGSVRSGFLEMSNVDLSNEFTEMIVTQRAYQANSRSISTSDQMLEELLALKR